MPAFQGFAGHDVKRRTAPTGIELRGREVRAARVAPCYAARWNTPWLGAKICNFLMVILDSPILSVRPAKERSAVRGSGLTVALLLFAQMAGAAAGAPAPLRPDEVSLAAIQALIGSARCTEDRECRSMGIGANPCGGPEQHLAWSTRVTDPDALQALAARHAGERRKLHEQTGLSSVCMLFPEPSVRCVRQDTDTASRCVLVPRPPGGPAVR